MRTCSESDPKKLHATSPRRLPEDKGTDDNVAERQRPAGFRTAARPALDSVSLPGPAQTADAGVAPEQASAVAIFAPQRTPPCSTCYARSGCLFYDALGPHDAVNAALTGQIVRSGQAIYSQGDPCRALYKLRVGSVRTDTTAAGGTQQVQGFYVTGDVFGLEAIGGGRHMCSATALEDTSLCYLPLDHLQSIVAGDARRLQRLFAVLAEDNAAHLKLRMLLNHSNAVQRVAAFLQQLAERMGSQSRSNTELQLSMSRYDIASYLGTAPETISRALSKLTREGLITVAGKYIRIEDHSGLAYYADPERDLYGGPARREACS